MSHSRAYDAAYPRPRKLQPALGRTHIVLAPRDITSMPCLPLSAGLGQSHPLRVPILSATRSQKPRWFHSLLRWCTHSEAQWCSLCLLQRLTLSSFHWTVPGPPSTCTACKYQGSQYSSKRRSSRRSPTYSMSHNGQAPQCRSTVGVVIVP
jgi:hypothetical protein